MASILPRGASRLPLRGPKSTPTTPITTPITTQSLPAPALTRLFTTTLPSQAQKIPPESPLFINVPNPPQDQSLEALRDQRRTRGFIPVPRKIFAHRDSAQKPKKAWLDRASPLPTNLSSQAAPTSAVADWKRKMAASRRQNIRMGMSGLWQRKKRSDAYRESVRASKQAEHIALSTAAEREDERLTRATINAGTLQTAVLRDPERFAKGLASAQRTAEIAADKASARQDAIQALYMNARTFIINEAELEAAVAENFADDFYSRKPAAARGYQPQNIWDIEDAPLTVAEMVRGARKRTSLLDEFSSKDNRTDHRQRRVAEELTGGKMDDKKSV
ncbi:hypothetical protein F4777DRAFT_535405 [Nemania sp. FL0916]|nr:hypothetical protein F4777DRAFT_535405 [Nemania sp. FL0916]